MNTPTRGCQTCRPGFPGRARAAVRVRGLGSLSSTSRPSSSTGTRHSSGRGELMLLTWLSPVCSKNRGGLEEMFTINELELPASLLRCLGRTNIIESCFSGARGRTRRVSHWQDGSMVLRWAASALLAKKNFRRILGYEALPILEAKLSELARSKEIVRERKVS